MKAILVIVALVLLTACTTRTEYGECVGIGDEKDPALFYKIDGWNLGLSIVFIESIVVPVVVAVNETFCPVGKRSKA